MANGYMFCMVSIRYFASVEEYLEEDGDSCKDEKYCDSLEYPTDSVIVVHQTYNQSK